MPDRPSSLVRWTQILIGPVALAVTGYIVQWGFTRENLNREYVSLAVSVLEQKHVDPTLREYAVELLKARSPIPLRPDLLEKLRAGKVRLPPAGYGSGGFGAGPFGGGGGWSGGEWDKETWGPRRHDLKPLPDDQSGIKRLPYSPP